MVPFNFTRASDSAGALAQHDRYSEYIAGGTCLLDLMKLRVQTPRHLIDINALPLDRIEEYEGGVRIGALARNTDLALHPLIRERYPMLSEALLSGASGQLRNMATVGGNIMQRTRCAYFRDTVFPCNKREPGSGCSAIDGYNRMHAVLGVSPQCIAVMPSDMCVALAALDAVVKTQRLSSARHASGEPHSITEGSEPSASERSIPFVDFHLLPEDHPERESVLEPGELITAVDIPELPWARRSRYLKLRDRASYAFALVSVAAALDISDGFIHHARLALGGVGTKPWRAFDAERSLIGMPATEDSFKAAASIALHGATAFAHNGFKIELARRAIVRTLSDIGAMP